MIPATFLAVGLGEARGARLRGWLGTRFNPLLAHRSLVMPIADLSGNSLIGAAIALFTVRHGLPREGGPFVVTGFPAALTAGIHPGAPATTAPGPWPIVRLQA